MAKPHITPSNGNKSNDLGYEGSDLPLRGVTIFILVMTLLIVVSMVGLTFLFNNFEQNAALRDRPVSPLVATQAPPPEPNLQASPREDLKNMQAAQEAILNNYGWVDQSKGIVRIPIERAIELTVERGLPVR